MQIRRTAAALSATAALSLSGVALATPAQAANLGQSGLVNVGVILEDVTIQVPVAAALNICDVNAAVLGVITDEGTVDCEAFADSQANA